MCFVFALRCGFGGGVCFSFAYFIGLCVFVIVVLLLLWFSVFMIVILGVIYGFACFVVWVLSFAC